MQPRFSSMALLIYTIGDLCMFIYNLPYAEFFKFSKDQIYRGCQIAFNVTSVVFKFLYSLNYRGFFYQSYYTLMTIGYIICGNYNKVGPILDKYDAFEEEERKLVSGDFISLFEHLKKRGNVSESHAIADNIISDIIEEVATMCEKEAGLDMSCNNTSVGEGWEAEIEILEKEGLGKCEVDKENESGYFEEEILD